MPTEKNAKPRLSLAATACLMGLGLGVLVVIAGLVWTVVGGSRTVYSDEQAAEYSDAATALHAATSGHDHTSDPEAAKGPPVDRDAAVAAARKRFDVAQSALESAKFAKNELGKWLMGLGLAATVAFGIGYVACREDST